MASIRNSMSMTDNVTPVLRAMLKAMDSTLKTMDLINKQASQGVQSKAFKQAEKDIQRANNALIRLGNSAIMGNSRVQSSTQKSIREMNLLEVAAYRAGKAMSSIRATPTATYMAGRMSGVRNFMSAPFATMQAKGSELIAQSNMLGGSRLQGIAGGALQTLGALGTRAAAVFGKIGSHAVTAFSVARNTVTQFASAAGSALSNLSNRAKMSWQSIASGIYTIKTVIGALSSLTGLTDKVISDTAKLGVQNYSSISNAQAYGLAYQAAQASRSDISTTSNLASRIAMSGVYGQGEGSLESSIAMAETIQKALALGGGTAEENSRAILQLSQGLSSGTLQGDELRSIREQSPYLTDMLAQGLAKVDESFANVTAGDLKELGSQGKLTSDVVIKAFEAMEDQIDKTFEEKAPRTWGQGVTSIGNTVKFVIGLLQDMEGGPLQKISELVWTIADFMQSERGLQVMAGIAAAIGGIGEVLTFVVDAALNLVGWLIDNSYVLIAVFTALGIVALIAGIQALIAWIAATWPLLLIIAIIALIIYAFISMGASIEEIAGVIAGIFTTLGAIIGNIFVAAINFVIDVFVVLWNFIASFVNFFANVFDDPITAIKRLFFDLVDSALGLLQTLASVIDTLFGSNMAGAVQGWRDDLSAWVDEKYGKGKEIMAKLDSEDLHVQRFEYGQAWDAGYNWGSGIVDSISESASKLTAGFDGSKTLATSVEGGNLDSIGQIDSDVDISDEDIKLLRDMAARDYLLQLQTITPVAHVTFGDVRETADVNKIVEVIETMVEEQMATALVS